MYTPDDVVKEIMKVINIASEMCDKNIRVRRILDRETSSAGETFRLELNAPESV